jgi:hypothetical protein
LVREAPSLLEIISDTFSIPGSYTFAKTLEYKAKQGLNSGKQVTVVPPREYQKRFVAAMNDYFLPCPGMFSWLELKHLVHQLCRQVVEACGWLQLQRRPLVFG